MSTKTTEDLIELSKLVPDPAGLIPVSPDHEAEMAQRRSEGWQFAIGGTSRQVWDKKVARNIHTVVPLYRCERQVPDVGIVTFASERADALLNQIASWEESRAARKPELKPEVAKPEPRPEFEPVKTDAQARKHGWALSQLGRWSTSTKPFLAEKRVDGVLVAISAKTADERLAKLNDFDSGRHDRAA